MVAIAALTAVKPTEPAVPGRPAQNERSARFGLFGGGERIPLDVMIAKNGVLSRTVIEVLGYHPFALALARNNYERLERFLDIACWIVASMGIPLILEKVFNGYLTRQYLAKTFKTNLLTPSKTQSIRPYEVPFEWLDKAGFAKRMAAYQRNPEKLRQLQKLGVKSFKHLTPQLAKALLIGKIGIMFTDYFVMACKGQGYSWGKNLVTQKLSKKEGFSGEFSYTDEAFRAEKTEKFKEKQKKQLIQSLAIGFGGAFLTPLVTWGLLRNDQISMNPKLSRGPMAGLKRLIPVLNPYKGVFMSRWGLLPHNIFNWNIPAILAARDGHELRELLVRAFVFDFFYFIGDDIFSGLAAKVFQKRYKDQLKGITLNGKPIQFTKKSLLGIPVGVSFGEIHYHLNDGQLRHLPQNTKQLIQRLSRYQFWTGILTTALFFGVATTLLNNWYTRQRVEAEKAELALKQQKQSETRAETRSAPKHHRSVPSPQQQMPSSPSYPPATTWLSTAPPAYNGMPFINADPDMIRPRQPLHLPTLN